MRQPLSVIDSKDRYSVICSDGESTYEFTLQEGLFGLGKFFHDGSDHYIRCNYDLGNKSYTIFRALDDKLIAYGTGEIITYDDLRCTSFIFIKWFNKKIYG